MAPDDEELEGRVAIIGMAGRFPGAPDIAAFWSNLRRGVESIVSFSEDELLAAGESLDNIRDPSYVRAAAPLDDIDQFDAGFFGMSPRDAAVFDPQHRLFLEVAWECFEHAGYVGERIDGAVGVFASCGLSEYMFKNVLANEHISTSVGEWLVRHTGNDTNFLATRVSYELDLNGPSLNVQTACSSTLVAVHLACQSLLSGECDVALAGGAVVAPVQRRGYFYKEGEILSPDGHCRAFDAKSAGTVISSACGAVLLKPLTNAIDDGDHVLAVVRGSAINNDGRAKVGYLAPSVPGQAQVVTEALAVAGVDPRDVTYVEAHGTGTLIGDPIEIAGLTQAYRRSTDDNQFCAIGSLKSNIGHTGEAAGVSALIKTVLSLQHQEIPPSLHFEEPNPQADFPNSPFFVNAALRPWEPGPCGTRIAGITGLGAGGTNAHVLVEEAPATEPSSPSDRPQLMTVSARTADGVRRAAAELAAHLRAHPDVELADVAYTRLVGRKPFAMRRAVVATTAAEAAEALEAPGKAVDAAHHGEAPSVVFMMPGGGAQYPGMGRELYDTEPVYRAVIDECAASLRRAGGIDLLAALFADGGRDESFARSGTRSAHSDQAARRLEAPSIALPALFATEVAMGRLLESWGITPAAMIGHSAGEYAAACLSGVVTMEDGLALIALRGRLFETLPKGAMVSVSLPEDELRPLLPDGLSIAAINAADLCVASGPEALVAELEATLAQRDVDTARIRIDVAAHSSMLEPILAEFEAFCRRTTFKPPVIPYVSNLTGTWITAADVTDPDYWVRHLRNAVRFRDGVDTILSNTNRVLLEVGPGRTLVSLARMAAATPAAVSPTLRHPKEVASDVAVAVAAVGRAWEAGVELDPAKLFAGEQRRRVALPTYPFDRQRYWVEPDAADTPRSSAKGVLRKRPLIDEWFSTPSWRRATAAPLPDPPAGPVVLISDGNPLAAALASALAPSRRVVPVVFGERFQRRAGGRFEVNPARADDWTALVDALVGGALPGTILHMTAIGPSRGRRRFGFGPDVELVAFRETVETDHASVLFLARALSALSEPVRLALVTSGVHGLDSADAMAPERALMHGACRVIPRELGHVEALAIDIDAAKARICRGDRTRVGDRARARRRVVHRRRRPPARRAVGADVRAARARSRGRVAVAGERRPPHHRRLRRHRHVDRPAHCQELGIADARARRAQPIAAGEHLGRAAHVRRPRRHHPPPHRGGAAAADARRHRRRRHRRRHRRGRARRVGRRRASRARAHRHRHPRRRHPPRRADRPAHAGSRVGGRRRQGQGCAGARSGARRRPARPVRALLVGQLDHRPARPGRLHRGQRLPRRLRSEGQPRRAYPRRWSSTGTRGRRSAWLSRRRGSSGTRRRCVAPTPPATRPSCSTPSTVTTRWRRSPPGSAASATGCCPSTSCAAARR